MRLFCDIIIDQKLLIIVFPLLFFKKNGLVLELALNYGRPVIALNGRRETAAISSLHDNEWHRLDLFMSKTVSLFCLNFYFDDMLLITIISRIK